MSDMKIGALMDIDIDAIRRDLKDKYGTALFSGFPAAVIDLSKIEKATDEKILEIATKNGMDLSKYVK